MPTVVTALLAANLVIIAWNVVVAVRAVQGRQGTPPDRVLTALAAMLVVPGAVVALTSSTLASGRAIYVIEWLWPATIGIFTAQAAVALWRGRTTRWFSAPAFAMNATLFAAALARMATSYREDPPASLLAVAAAHAGALGLLMGPTALWSPLTLQAPVLVAPAATTWRSGKTWRLLLAVWCTATAAVVALEYPPSVHATRGYDAIAERAQKGTDRGDLRLGLRILPSISSPPRALALREDLALLDSLGTSVIAVVVTPRAARGATLDSLARALQRHRRDSTLLVVALGYDGSDRRAYERDPDAYARYRSSALEEVVRRLRPEVALPALDPHAAGTRALGNAPNRWWRALLRDGAAAAKRAQPRTRVGVLVSSFTPPDSELFAWAAQPSTALDFVGFAIRPSFSGAASLEARFRAAERWSRGVQKPQWIVATGAYPRLAGDRNQERSLRAITLWASRQPSVVGVIIDGSGDHETLTGLRAPGGRIRRAAGVVGGIGAGG